MIIWLASGNIHKRQELAAILAGHRLRLPAEGGIEDFDPPETETSFAGNALLKARALYGLLGEHLGTGTAVLADDSGLCVDALGGRPGIFSARYCGPPDRGGLPPSGGKKLGAAERNALLVEELNGAVKNSGAKGGSFRQDPPDRPGPASRRSCRFVCAMVLLFTPDRFYLIEETLEGEIVPHIGAVRGGGGFGYDPIVYLPELGRTVAELSEDEKNRLSHRGKAGRLIRSLLEG
ncbi:MAG: non-canonical purine NTP pyrophosphatase [Spirochaetaceae bacterium]|jgi:XTP/dITP diphosphohydrolase|nr:non-canonical purine NTP pyrophosphatase [Spirochaetaceae bacterium]